jgi:hypothetical protein
MDDCHLGKITKLKKKNHYLVYNNKKQIVHASQAWKLISISKTMFEE